MRPVWSAGARAGPRIILVLRGQDRPTQSLLHAIALARSLDARLHVLAVVPRASGLSRLLRDGAASGRRAAAQTRDMYKALCTWLRDLLDTRRAIEHVAVRYGDFVTQTAVYAANIQAQLILVAGADPVRGTDVTSLSMAAATPVLLLRGKHSCGTIVAATDLLSPNYPVLAHAAELGRRVNGSVVAIHNVQPEPVAGAEVAIMGYIPVHRSPEKARALRLADAAERMPAVTQTVVRSEQSSAGAVLSEARARAADLVVVGTRRRAWLDRVWHCSVSASIVNSASCSVLVLPLDTTAPSYGSAPA